MAEPDPVDSLDGQELLGGGTRNGGAPTRKGRGAFATASGVLASDSVLRDQPSNNGLADLEPLSTGETGFQLANGVDPNARIAIRYAVESDSDLRKEAKQSEWYKRHGRQAGKETTTAPRNLRYEPDEQPSLLGRTAGEGKDFASRLGRRQEPYNRSARRPRRTQEELDRELEKMVERRVNGDDEGVNLEGDVEMHSASSRDSRRRRPQKGAEDLDRGERDV